MRYPRILFLTTYYHPFIGGTETHARQLAQYLSVNGFEVVILTKCVASSFPIREQLDGIRVYRIPPGGERAPLQKWLMIPIAMLWILFLNHKFDLIYCPEYRGLGIAALLVGKLLRRPVVIRSANIGILQCQNFDQYFSRVGVTPQSRLAKFIKWPFQKLYSSASALVCNSRQTLEESSQCDPRPKKIFFIAQGVNTTRFRPASPREACRIRCEEGWPENCVIFIYVGRLSIEKGIVELVEAWRFIKDPDVLLVAIGPDMPGHPMDAGEKVRTLVMEAAMGDRVKLCGTREDVPRLLRAADVFVQPSTFETFSNAVLEAMATGLPVIATNIPGMRECLIDGVNGLLCEVGIREDLVQKITLLVGDPGLRDRLGKEAKATVDRHFSESDIFEKFSSCFQEISGQEISV